MRREDIIEIVGIGFLASILTALLTMGTIYPFKVHKLRSELEAINQENIELRREVKLLEEENNELNFEKSLERTCGLEVVECEDD